MRNDENDCNKKEKDVCADLKADWFFVGLLMVCCIIFAIVTRSLLVLGFFMIFLVPAILLLLDITHERKHPEKEYEIGAH